MNKKINPINTIALALSFILMIFVVVSCSAKNENCESYKYGSNQWQDCYKAKAEQHKQEYKKYINPSDCDKADVPSECYKEMAIKNNNLSLCKKVEELSVTSYGGSLCYSDVGIANHNIEGCEKAGDFDKMMCYKDVAIKTGNKDLCEKLNMDRIEGNLKDDCIKKAEAATP